MEKDMFKDLCLINELEMSKKLITLGFAEYQKLNLGNDFYHGAFQLISSGFERLMKCHICLGFHEQNQCYPKGEVLKKPGHDLSKLKTIIVNQYFSVNGIKMLRADYHLLKEDEKLQQLIDLLSIFGECARYYHFDVITSTKKPTPDVRSAWMEYETSIILSDSNLISKIGEIQFQDEIYNQVKSKILITLERFVRAISRQFTMGKLGGKATQYSPILSQFFMLRDEQLGMTDYR